MWWWSDVMVECELALAGAASSGLGDRPVDEIVGQRIVRMARQSFPEHYPSRQDVAGVVRLVETCIDLGVSRTVAPIAMARVMAWVLEDSMMVQAAQLYLLIGACHPADYADRLFDELLCLPADVTTARVERA